MKMKNRFLDKIKDAYNKSLEDYYRGVDPLRNLPPELQNSPGIKALLEESAGNNLNSGSPDIKEYLDPKPGMKYLDGGCCGNLAVYRPDKWASTYYGIDISDKMIEAMKGFAEKKKLKIGRLYVSELANMPFEDNLFDIASVIGVFEYCPLDYIEKAIGELHRVLKPGSRAVLDFPNPNHTHYNDMCKLEEFLGRKVIEKSREDFEKLLLKNFKINFVNADAIMIKYYTINR